ncbi:uncharacterized protein J7T54_006686 [Emericellopsis cladophorae]|uniref:Uncharacterized protein n=1 Tax=Emericellopsis cladophorae TaxID=2686198 RepID=A0A9Q0BH36_9HYPO|nr:uncharacterized protein J7T54_006686 [Emericellopsis cladophorae]KAI6784641.1 hypothetical protein J7T54_006686 [Emericellopsis cladophorae]
MAATATQSPARPAARPAARPDRSNSLQRMLELEQECMRDRRTHIKRGQVSPESQGTPVSLQLPPIDTGTSSLNPAQMFATIHSRQRSDGDQQNTLASAHGSPKRVSFSTVEKVVVDDRNELCQSPSWQAYDRRKKEKKERELADRETSRAQRRKLCKAPPSPSTALVEKAGQTQTGACMSHTSPVPQPPPRQQEATSERPNSVAGLSTPNMPALDSAKPRGRSSSISSLFRAPFEVRRASPDTDNRDGFIGGIKLEQHRLAANQKILEDQAAEARKAAQKNRKRSESPLRYLVPRSEPKETRAYPPIAIHTTGNQALISQDDGMMRKWKARVGLRSRSREPLPNGGQKLAKLPAAKGSPISAPVVMSSSTPDVSSNTVQLPSSKSTPNINSPTVVQRIHGPVDVEKMNMLTVDPARHPIFDEGGTGSASERSFTTVPESPPAPPRRSSRRKSTVNAEDLENPVPLLSSQTLPVAKPSTEIEERLERWTMSHPPSIPYGSVNPSTESLPANHQQRRTFREAARAAFSAHTALSPPVMPAATAYRPGSRSRSPTTRTLRNTDERVLPADKYNRLRGGTFGKNGHMPAIQDWSTNCATAPPTPPYHSSEDSAWDSFRSPGEHGTPDTSRPQSARSMFSSFGDERKKGRQFRVLPSPAFSLDETRQSNQPSPLELDPIQAAALKVMAAFPDSNACRSPSLKPRHAGDEQQELARINTTVAREQDPASKSPPLRELLMARDETSVVVPWPATYLEAARKAAPSAQAPLKSSPTVGPQTLPILREPIAKTFVECCACKYFHDLPSKLYKAMANPDGVVALGDEVRVGGNVSMTVKCPWCTHEMTTKCCAGLAAMVHVKEKLH